MEHEQTIRKVVDEVWEEVKEDTLTIQKLKTLADKGIKFGDINLEEVIKPRYHPTENAEMLRGELERLAPIKQDEVVTSALKFYLLTAAYQRNVQTATAAIRKLLNLIEK